ncbi:MAG: ComF family protein [Chlorobiaceae bacterium]|nr:ComF family protein [Chlorobiaceae bacterium]
MFEQQLHLLFPHVCLLCRKLLLPGEEYCCSSCMAEFHPFTSPLAAEELLHRTLVSHFGQQFLFERGWCRYQFHKKSPLQQVLHAMKYEGLFNLARSFGRQLGEWMLTEADVGDIGCIVPVPLHPLKKIERSYNQSEKIAEGIAQSLQKPLRTDILVRKRYTVSQTGLSAQARKKNPEGAFTVRKVLPAGHVLLVDDVVTTGATMAAAASALREGGAERVFLAAVALAIKE